MEMPESEQSASPIVRMLLENLTASLTQLVIKYESVAKDCERLEHHLSTISAPIGEMGEMKSALSRIKSQCEQSASVLEKLGKDTSSARSDIGAIATSTEKTLSIHNTKLEAVGGQLREVKSVVEKGVADILDGQEALKDRLKEGSTQRIAILKEVGPITNLSKLISKPITIALFILALLVAIWGVVEVVNKTKTAAEMTIVPATKTAPVVPGAAKP